MAGTDAGSAKALIVAQRSWIDTPVEHPSSLSTVTVKGVPSTEVLSVELLAAGDGERCAEHPACVFEHEVDLLGGYLFSGNNQVAFVFAVFVIDHNNHFPFAEIDEGAFY